MNPLKILAVDDREDNLIVLDALLRGEGVEVLKAQSASAALELLLVHDVAVALLDVQMPETNGFELAELMRGAERTRHVPIIFLTAGTRDASRPFQGYDSGAVDFLFKPLDANILRHKVRVFLELYRQGQILRDTLRLNEELVAVVGHDLRSPLAAILLGAAVLEGSSDPEAVRVAGHLRSSGTRMHRIIEDLLDLSRARLAGGIPVAPRRIDLAPLSRKVISELLTANPTRRIDLRVEGDAHGDWDGSRLEQIGSNLIGNALRHGKADSAIDVLIDGSSPDGVKLSVHNGGRIPPDLVPRLFEPFQDRGGRRGRAEGLGLGLYIVQQIAIAHGGDVTVDSTAARGTTFCVSLPRHAARS